jgi:formylglycine-generating enzyme
VRSCCPGRKADTTERGVHSVRPGAGSTVTIAMVGIPEGTFTMGTDDPAGYPDDGEGPAHAVSLPPFNMAVHAVTNDLFTGFIDATG